jgi:hypothetical protein
MTLHINRPIFRASVFLKNQIDFFCASLRLGPPLTSRNYNEKNRDPSPFHINTLLLCEYNERNKFINDNDTIRHNKNDHRKNKKREFVLDPQCKVYPLGRLLETWGYWDQLG